MLILGIILALIFGIMPFIYILFKIQKVEKFENAITDEEKEMLKDFNDGCSKCSTCDDVRATLDRALSIFLRPDNTFIPQCKGQAGTSCFVEGNKNNCNTCDDVKQAMIAHFEKKEISKYKQCKKSMFREGAYKVPTRIKGDPCSSCYNIKINIMN